MSGLWQRLTEILGWAPPDEEELDERWHEEAAAEDEDELGSWGDDGMQGHGSDGRIHAGRKGSEIVSLSGRGRGRPVQLAVAEPGSFDDVQSVADQLKKHVGVVVNLESLERGEARRVVDFLSGTVYALDGEMQQVSAQVVMFVPRQTRIENLKDSEAGAVARSISRSSDDEERPW